MRVEIEEYRGWVITFDTEKETFYAISDSYDSDVNKQSYASCKKYIDDYIKDNQEFIPFFAEKAPSYYSGGNDKKIRVIGIRKDRLFTYEDAKGKKQTLSKYNEKDYMLVNAINDPIKLQVQELRGKVEQLNEEVKGLLKTMTVKTLEEVKQNYIK